MQSSESSSSSHLRFIHCRLPSFKYQSWQIYSFAKNSKLKALHKTVQIHFFVLNLIIQHFQHYHMIIGEIENKHFHVCVCCNVKTLIFLELLKQMLRLRVRKVRNSKVQIKKTYTRVFEAVNRRICAFFPPWHDCTFKVYLEITDSIIKTVLY